MVCCIRGAITINENTKEDVYSNTEEMLKTIIDENGLDISQIISIVLQQLEI